MNPEETTKKRKLMNKKEIETQQPKHYKYSGNKNIQKVIIKNNDNNNNDDDDDKLKKILNDFFNLSIEHIIKQIRNMLPSCTNHVDKFETKFKDFKNYLLKNPMLLLDGLDYILPLVKNNESNKNEYVRALKEGFKNNSEMTLYLNNKFLMTYDINISKNIYILLKILLIDILKNYHNIYNPSTDKDKELKELLIKEYTHRRKK